MNPATIIKTERLVLVPLKSEHANHLFSLLSSEVHTQFLSLPLATSLESVQSMTNGILSQPGNCLWLIETRAGNFIGICGFLGDSEIPNFIYSVVENEQSKGYAYEAAAAAISRGMDILGIKRVELNIHSENRPSLRVAEKLGFTKVGESQHPYPQQAHPAKTLIFGKMHL